MGVFVTSVQLVVVKSKSCCNTKFVEGTVHESMRLPFVGVIFMEGVGVIREVQIPPPLMVATRVFPFADEATDVQYCTGTLLNVQVIPEFVEV